MENGQVIEVINKMGDTTFEVFCEMLEMKSQTEIADSLGLNIKSVKYHVGLIYRSFGIDKCDGSTHSKRLLFTREFMNCKPKEGLGISDLVD